MYSSSSLTMNQLCKVCGEPAAGFHFGAFTCEGCKSFFGRTYNNLSSMSECKNNGRCVINKKNRTSCKSCRLRKCLMVGMSKSGSRYGRRSNWFKIHCLLQDQASLSGQLEAGLHGGSVGVLNGQGTTASGFNGALNAAAAAAAKLVAYDAAVKESRDHAVKEEIMTSSPESQSQGGDSCSEPDAKLKGSGSLSPLSPYESPSPPYEKKESSASGGYVHSLPMSPVSPVTNMHHHHHPQPKFFFTPTSSAAAAAAAAAAAIGGFIPTGFNGFHHHHHHALHHQLQGNSPLTFRPYAAAAALGGLDFLVRKHHKPFLVDVAVGVHGSNPASRCPPPAPSSGTASNRGQDHQEAPMDLTVRRMSERRRNNQNHQGDSGDSSEEVDEDEDDESYGTVMATCDPGKERGEPDEQGPFSAKSAEPERVQVPLDLTKRA